SFLPAVDRPAQAQVALRWKPALPLGHTATLGAINLALLIVVGTGMIAYRAVPNLRPEAQAAAISAALPVQAAEAVARTGRPVPAVEISAVMPAYNEEANLEQSVGRMASALQTFTRGFEIIVVDDGSQDGTPAVLERLKVAHPNLRVIRHPVNRGYGAALRSGFSAARFSWIFLMDADNQFDPAEVELLLARAADADIVAGYRKHRRHPLLRRLN